MTVLKSPGAPCPRCKAANCAEYAQLGQRAQWTCHVCKTTGDLVGELSIRSKADAKPAQGTGVKPHWRSR